MSNRKPTTSLSFNINDFECVTTQKAFDRWIKRLHEAKPSICFDTETSSLDTFTCSLAGLSFAVVAGPKVDACYIPVGHRKELGPQLPLAYVLKAVKPLLESGKAVVGANLLFDMLVLAQPRYDITIANAHDTQLMSYVYTGNQHFTHGMDALAERILGYQTIKFSDIVNEDIGVPDFTYVRHDVATKYSGEDTAVTLVIAKVLQRKLKEAKRWHVYNDIDRPLLPVLRDMKLRGTKVASKRLDELRTLWTPELERLTKKAHKQAGEKFNLRAPQQVARILYTPIEEGGRFGVPCEQFTDKGHQSADKEALENIPGVPLVETILEFKEYATLTSTFVNGLPEKIRPDTKRVHSDLKITSTKTRRFSSADPNVQNIPTRTEQGAMMREAFVAERGFVLISADYSQIEYRILAHVTGDPYLLHAFNTGIDMHAKMAADVRGGTWEQYNDKKDKVRYAVRSSFKNVNFATVYGAGPGRVAYMSKIDLAEAYSLLAAHQEMCPGVYDWKEEMLDLARQTKYVDNLFGGRTWVLGINSNKRDIKGHAERLAINAPIQGGAAELIRKAMPHVHATLNGQGFLLMQVHDELVLEARTKYAEAVAGRVQIAMQTAADDVIAWKVPIKAETGIGNNWREAK